MDEGREAIRANNRKFEEAFLRGDAGAIAALYTDDAHLLPPNQPAARGREAVRAFWQAAMGMGIKEASLETLDVEAAGEQAAEIGRFTLAVEVGGGARSALTGKYVVLWKRDGDGWLLHVDIWNTDAPM